MLVSDFGYHLPKNLIAQKPIKPRDQSRLLVLNRQGKKISHHHFFELGQFLKRGDVLVLNNTKVFPARLIGRKVTGGKIEVFLLKRINGQIWECLLGGHGRGEKLKINFNKNLKGEIINPVREINFSNGVKKPSDGVWQIKFNCGGKKLEKIINQIGQTPTPPYIKTPANKNDYQTIYAKKTGSVAAPTAGFHFTKKLINQLKKQGIQFEFVTLQVGYGTFQPIKVKKIEEHKMHPELAILDCQTAEKLNQAKKQGRRVIAVGTTTVRVLESFADKNGRLKAGRKDTNIFIYPGYKFRFIDALITNFHLPQSTLLMLVSALVGRKLILKTYQTAVRKKYRFYSFGDAMMIN